MTLFVYDRFTDLPSLFAPLQVVRRSPEDVQAFDDLRYKGVC